MGVLLKIFIAPPCGPNPPPAGGWGHKNVNKMISIDEAELVAGAGIVGDRWFGVKEYKLKGGATEKFRKNREISLIGIEQVNELGKYKIKPIMLRRNLLTRGIVLKELVGKVFKVGSVELRCEELCQPCKHIERYTNSPGLIKSLFNKGGVRASVLAGGTIKIGDEICL